MKRISSTLPWLAGLPAALHLFASPAPGADRLQRIPLAEPSAAPGSTLFTTLAPETTGITVRNPYDDPSMWGKRYREYMGGAMGSGIAVGDYDNDGRPDLYVSTKTARGRLYRNLGAWTFSDVSENAGLVEAAPMFGWLRRAASGSTSPVWHQGAVFADVDNDGWLDLYVCRNNAANLLFINQRDGTFREEAEARGLGVVDGSVVGAFADYDRDGWLDVLVLTNQVDGSEASGRPDRLFRNTGAGRFVEVTHEAGISGGTFGHSATWLDFDEDGWPDLHVANDFAGADRLYRNNRDGTFTDVLDAVVPHTPYSSMGADVTDVDNDGHFDLFVADMATTTREKDRRGLAASRDDVLTMGTRAGTAPQYMRNALLLNTGRGVFREAACWARIDATDWTWSPRFEDFDNDSWQDLHITNGMVREANNGDLLARMMRALSDMERIAVMRDSPVLAEANLAFRNDQGRGFEPVSGTWGLGMVGVSFGSATGDFDGDGDLDLVHIDQDGGLTVLRNDVPFRHRLQVRLRGQRSNRFGVGAVVRIQTASGWQTRGMTVARGYASGSDLLAHFGLGAETHVERLVVEWPSGTRQVIEDLPADIAYVVTEEESAVATDPEVPPSLLRPAPDAHGLALQDASALAIPDKEQAFIPFRTDRAGPSVAVGDLDGDGHDDIVLGATTGSPARWLRRTEDGFVPGSIPGLHPSSVEDGPLLIFDADGDGALDLLVTRASAVHTAWPAAYSPILYMNDGNGTFTQGSHLPEIALNAGAACAADIDGDGDADVFLGARSIPGRYPEVPQSLLLRNDAGHFSEITASSPGLEQVGLVKGALFSDADQDGRVDLLVATEWGPVRFYHNTGNGRFVERTSESGFQSGGLGWWNGIATADFNSDGRPDYVVGNAGLNSTYRPTSEHPVTLLRGDFARNGTQVLMEAVHDGEALYPLRARVDLGRRFPHILRKYPRNNDFARAPLTALFDEAVLRGAQRWTADTFDSGVFLSQPDGSHRFASLPRVAQIGPILGVVATDIDGDGFCDIAAVQNTDTAIPRFHGGVGLILLGRGDGTFESMHPTASGFVVPGNGRGLVVIDADGDARPDLFLTRHGGTSAGFLNAPGKANGLKIRLIGARGSVSIAGARLRLIRSDGSSTHWESTVGGGWMSQSGSEHYVPIDKANRLIEAQVTWPDGMTSVHRDVPDRGTWTIRAHRRP